MKNYNMKFRQPLYSLYLFVLLLASSCDYGYINKKYTGYFYETKWVYQFSLDGSFKMYIVQQLKICENARIHALCITH